MKKAIGNLGIKIVGALLVVLALGLSSCSKEDLEEPLSEAETNSAYITTQQGLYMCSGIVFELTKDKGVIQLQSAFEIIILTYKNGEYRDNHNNSLCRFYVNELWLYVPGGISKYIKQ